MQDPKAAATRTDELSLLGRVIDRARDPVPNLRVEVFHPSEVTRQAVPVIEGRTDPGGRFAFAVDAHKAGGIRVRLHQPVPMFLVLHSASGELLLRTRSVPVVWQVEYRIFLGRGKGEPGAKALYERMIERTLAGARQAHLRSGPPRGSWLKTAVFQDPSQESGMGANLLFAVSDGALSGSIAAPRLRPVEYDGAQVPRNAWESGDNQAVIWVRNERFRWD